MFQKGAFTHSVDPDATTQNAASYQGLFYLPCLAHSWLRWTILSFTSLMGAQTLKEGLRADNASYITPTKMGIRHFRIAFPLKELIAIRRIFSLIDMITNTKFSNCPNVLKLV